MCRLQSLKNIFGDPVYCENFLCDKCGFRKTWQLGETDELSDIAKEYDPWLISKIAYRLFYGAMPPWEHEEMGGVFNYLIYKINAIYKEIADNLRQLSKNTPCEFFSDILPIEQRPPSGCEIETERDLVHFPRQFKGLAGLGPGFLYRVLHRDRLSRRNTLCENARDCWSGQGHSLNLRLGSRGTINSHLPIQQTGMGPRISNISGLLCHILINLL